MRKVVTLLTLVGFCLPVWADFNADSRGTTTANFLKLGVGARAVGMGEAYSAVADDATALYWNPAGLSRIESRSASFMHAPYLVSTFYDFGAYADRHGRHAWGIGAQYFSAGRIPETDENNMSLGSFAPNDLAASLGYAFRLTEKGTAVGGTIKYVRSKIIDTAATWAVDAGIQTRPYFDRFRLAFAITNLGGKMKFEQEKESLPLSLRYGGALKLTDAWLASLDVVTPKDNETYMAMGTEYLWRLTTGLGLAGRLGYNSRTREDIDGVTGLSFGLGFAFEKISLDYALLPYGSLGLTHRISLNFKWGASNRRAVDSALELNYPNRGDEDLP